MNNSTNINIELLQDILYELSENGKEIASFTELEKIYTTRIEQKNKINEIRQKIENINIYRYNRTISAIYETSHLREIESMLDEILQKNDTKNISKELSELSKELDEELLTLNTLYTLDKHREYNLYSDVVFEYNVNGIIIKVNTKTKKYEISYDESIIKLLTECKVNKLKRLLSSKLPTVSSNEIIEPKYINEKKLSDIIKGKSISLKEILKYNINSLLKYLSLDTEIKKETSIKELSENHEKLKAVYDFIRILDLQGYETDKEQQKFIFEDITRKYHSINLESIPNIYTIISPIIFNSYPNENFVYSSLQIAYNCMNRNIIKLMHQDLLNGKNIEQSNMLKIVMEFIKKYSRNKEGKPYTDDEILNFLKQKNEIINANYSSDSYDYGEYNDTINSEVNNIMYKMTGRRR